MKKLLPLAILLATTSANAAYLKLGTGVSYSSPTTFKNDNYSGKIKIEHKFPVVEVGIGTNITDDIRAEIVYDYHFLFHSKEKASDRDNNKFKISHKHTANAIYANAYKDIVRYKAISLYGGGGIGISEIQTKAKGNVVTDEDNTHYQLDSAKSQKVRRFAWKLGAGIDLRLADNITAEVSYNYYNLGKNKPKIIAGINNIQKQEYCMHNASIALRIEV